MRSTAPTMELGLQVDPLATAGSLFVLGGFTALQIKIRGAIEKREERDAAAETFRKAEVLLLAGKLKAEDVDRAAANMKAASDAYEEARRIIALGGVLLRIPDPGAAEAERLLKKQESQLEGQGKVVADDGEIDTASSGSAAAPSNALDGVRDALGLNNPNAPISEDPDSLLPTGSRSITLKDVAIGFVFVLQVAWFALSLTDPIGPAGPLLNAALTSGGEYVDQREARRAAESAEYRAMLQAAVESGEAPPTCATRKIGDGLGCGAEADLNEVVDPEFARTRGLNANREWISGPPPTGGL